MRPRPLVAALLLWIAFAAALGSLPASAQAPDLILYRAKVFTADPARPWAQAIAIRGDRIVAVGRDAVISRLAGPATRRIDLGGRVVVPGFNDAHAHLGCQTKFKTLARTGPGPFPDPTFAVLADSLRALAARVPDGAWIGASVGMTVLNDTAARRAALDAVAPGHPVWLNAWTGHGHILNSRALDAAGIGDSTLDPVGGRYERESGSGRLTGLLEEYAGYAANRRLCGMDPESTLVAGLRSTGQALLRFGVTSVQNVTNELEPGLMMKVFRSAELPLRVRLVPTSMSSAAGRLHEWDAPLKTPGPLANANGGTVMVSGVKWILDGTPVERLAAHRTAYRDRPGFFGRLNFPPDTIRAILLEARKLHQQPWLHATGDSAVVAILSGMEQTGAETWRAERVRIEHGDGLMPDLLARARRLGIVLVANPTHLMDFPIWRERYDSTVLAHLSPMRSALAAGIPLAIGSDGPMSPFLNIMFAITDPKTPAEALTREQAVLAYTRGGAYAELGEREKGTLAPGMLADLAVLSQDIFVVPLDALPDTRSVLTLIGGRVAYDGLTRAARP